MKRFVVVASLGAALVLTASTGVAQQVHYWSEQYGNRARLLGGAVVGSATDLSAVYYNPGALTLVESPQLLLAGNVFEVKHTRLDDVAGSADASQWSAKIAPSLFAGEVKLGDRRNRLAYAFLTRQSAETRLKARLAQGLGELPVEGLDFVSEEFRIDSQLGEYWAGGTFARQLSDATGLGISTFFAVRTSRTRLENFAQALASDGRAIVALDQREFSYWNLRLLWKLGYSTRFREWQIGAALTTPSLSIAGRGDTSFDSTLVGQLVDAEGRPLTAVASDSQEHGASYRSPVSVAGGAARAFGDTRLHVSAEWFASSDPFTVVDSQPFIGQSSGEPIATALVSGRSSVLNLGVGLERRLNAGLQLYGGFASDFSAASEAPEVNDAKSQMNLYHFSGGAVLDVAGSDLTLGGVLAYGRSHLQDELNLGAALEEAQLSYLRFTFIIGFNFTL